MRRLFFENNKEYISRLEIENKRLEKELRYYKKYRIDYFIDSIIEFSSAEDIEKYLLIRAEANESMFKMIQYSSESFPMEMDAGKINRLNWLSDIKKDMMRKIEAAGIITRERKNK